MQRMLEEFQTKINSIPDLEAKLQEKNLSLHELLTIASLVEKEVVVDEERALVAGVIYNRINQDMKLEIDATVQYLLDRPKERLFYKDLKVKSPYNTYLNKGLPPGPIASPSLRSIEAALNPEASEYLFYVTKKDGSSGHLFAKTYKEHQQNIAKSKAAQ